MQPETAAGHCVYKGLYNADGAGQEKGRKQKMGRAGESALATVHCRSTVLNHVTHTPWVDRSILLHFSWL